MDSDVTAIFDVDKLKKKLISDMLKEVTITLKERGYEPINQIAGYLVSGDPGYISSYKDARSKILEFDRSEIMALLLEDYIKKNK